MPRKVGSKVEHAGEWKEGFLAALREVPNVLRAAQAVKVARSLCYRERESDAAFAAQWDEALATGRAVIVEAIESKVYDLATNNSSFRHNVLRIFLLKSYKPDVYGEKSELRLKGSRTDPLQVTHGVDLRGLSNQDLDLLESILTKSQHQHDDTDSTDTGSTDGTGNSSSEPE